MSEDKNGNNNHDCDCGCGHDHNHDHSHGCDCGHDHGEPTVIIDMGDGTEMECSVIGVFEALGREYIALLPNGEFDEVLVFRFSEENGEPKLEEIESDEEYDEVAKVFDELFDDDYDEDEEDDDEEEENEE